MLLPFQELQSSLSSRSNEVNTVAFDIQVFISERAQDLVPEQSRHLLGQLQQLQRAFHQASGQAQAQANTLSAQREREEERRLREKEKEDKEMEREREMQNAREREVRGGERVLAKMLAKILSSYPIITNNTFVTISK